MSEHLYTYLDPISARHLQKTSDVLKGGGIIVCPMGINWAFACDAASIKAIDRIRRLKPSHPRERPFSLVCSDISMASTVGNIDHQLYRTLKKAWPGPFTVIVKRNRTLPRQIKDKRQVVGIRIPDSPLVLGIVEHYGAPLAATSVPLKADQTSYQMGYEIFQAFGHGIDLLLDLGEELPGSESTIIDVSSGEAELVRSGVGDFSLFR